MKPLISVIVPVYNSEKFLKTCINSILNQTYNNFELILIDDGSKDNSLDIIRAYTDKRIKIFSNKTNSGLVKVRNLAIKLAKGKYIAWLDSDDYNHKKRLESQLNILENNSDIGICGTWAKTFGNFKINLKYETDPEIIYCQLLFEDPVATSSVMMRKQILIDNNLSFNLDFPLAEDYDLWQRMSKYCRIINIPKIYTFYRVHNDQTSTSLYAGIKHKMKIINIQKRQMLNLKITPNTKELELHYKISMYRYDKTIIFLKKSKKWFELLINQNRKILYYDHNYFLKLLSIKWYSICINNSQLGFRAYKIYNSFYISSFLTSKKKKNVILLVKCLFESLLLSLYNNTFKKIIK